GVAHVNTVSLGTLSAGICIPAPSSMASPGASCSVSGNSCSNGLCVLGNGSVSSYYCTEPCNTAADCTGFVDTSVQLSCNYVTLTEGSNSEGRTHAKVCIKGISSF